MLFSACRVLHSVLTYAALGSALLCSVHTACSRMRAPRERSTAGHTSPAHVRAEHCSWGREAPQDTRAQHMCVQSSAAGREKHGNTNEPSTSARAKYCGLKKVLRLEERSTAGHTNTHHARWCNLLLKGRLVHFEFMPQGVLVHATLIRQDGCINEGLQDSPRKQHSAGGRSTGCAAATKRAQTGARLQGLA